METKKTLLILAGLLIIIFTFTSLSCFKDVTKKQKTDVDPLELIVKKEINIIDIEGREIKNSHIEIYINSETEDTQPDITIVELDNDFFSPLEGSNSVGKFFWIVSERDLTGPIILTLSYNPSDLQTGAKEENLFIAVMENDSWRIIEEGIIDTGNKTVSIAVDHFSVFGTFEGEKGEYKTATGQSSLESRAGLLGSFSLPEISKEKIKAYPTELPKGTVSLKGEVWDGKKISLTINFDQKSFSGSVSLDNKDAYIKETTAIGYIDVNDVEGNTRFIKCTGSASKVIKKDSSVVDYYFDIVVVINKEMNSVQGFLLEGDREDGRMLAKKFEARRTEKLEEEKTTEEKDEEKIETEEVAEQTQEIHEDDFPDEPVIYKGSIEGVGISLIVDFGNKAVSGSISSDDGVWYIDAPIVDGSISDMETLELTASFDGVIGNREAGRSEPFNGSINGSISKDLKIFKGTLFEAVEGVSIEFTATSK
jgi:hypothetical protein